MYYSKNDAILKDFYCISTEVTPITIEKADLSLSTFIVVPRAAITAHKTKANHGCSVVNPHIGF